MVGSLSVSHAHAPMFRGCLRIYLVRCILSRNGNRVVRLHDEQPRADVRNTKFECGGKFRASLKFSQSFDYTVC